MKSVTVRLEFGNGGSGPAQATKHVGRRGELERVVPFS